MSTSSSSSSVRADLERVIKGPWWLLFSSTRGIKYMNDQTHSAAWCNACLDAYVRREQSDDQERVAEGILSSVRTIDELRKQGEFGHIELSIQYILTLAISHEPDSC